MADVVFLGEITMERVITIRGKVSSCMRATAAVLTKIVHENESGCYYHVNGTGYPKSMAKAMAGLSSNRVQPSRSSSSPTAPTRGNVLGREVSTGSRGTWNREVDDVSLSRSKCLFFGMTDATLISQLSGVGVPFGKAETLSANTIIEIAIPNDVVGAILGVKVRGFV